MALWFVRLADIVMLRVDSTGDARPDFKVEIQGIAHLVGTDFLF